MKKSILFLVLSSIIFFTTKAQTTELWGITSGGGTYDSGTIFKTDANGDNQEKVYEWFKYEGAEPVGGLLQIANGKIYGMAREIYDSDILFEYDPSTDTYTKKFEFGSQLSIDGDDPVGSLIQASNGKLYGMTEYGGTDNKGVIFEYIPAINTYTKKFDFDYNSGTHPKGSLIQATNGKLYGMTGGVYHSGTIFEYDPLTNTYTKKYDFNQTNGTDPKGSLIQASNGKMYGMTYLGGANDDGVLFEFDPATGTYTKKLDFDGTNGSHPKGSLMQASNGKLYGMTANGGADGKGVLFEYDPATDTYTKKLDFDGTNGSHPKGSLMQASNGKLYGMTANGGVNDDGVIFEYDPITNSYNKKMDFDGSNSGKEPHSFLMQATNGKLYGMTKKGGSYDLGVLFEYAPSTDTYIKKLDFGKSENGESPAGSLIRATNGKLYGVTVQGGSYDYGVLFEYDPVNHIYTKKIDFYWTIGANPSCSLFQGSNGKLYGTAARGGAYGYGVIYEYDTATDTYTKKFDFGGTNGSNPLSSLIQVSNDKLYGMTDTGGDNLSGVIYEYDLTTNIYTKKFDFGGVNGANPSGSLVQASNGKLYGMTSLGGANQDGVLFEFDTATNTYTKKLDFDGTNGYRPYVCSLIKASNGKLYGMTGLGGANNRGVLFEYDSATDIYTIKYDFDLTNGAEPSGSLMQASNGKLYGVTSMGGAYDYGVLFEYDPVTNIYIKKLDFDFNNGQNPEGPLIEIPYATSIENQVNENIKISPNPTTNFVKISMSEKPVKVSVVNLAGVLIYETDQTSKEMTIDMSNYAKAVYLVKIRTDKGVATYKVIKR